MSPLMVSVLLSLVSAAAYAGAALLQERVAATGSADQGSGAAYAPVRSRGWWASVALNGSGALLHVGALAYGPLSLVQPLGALTIVFVLPMAAVFLGRRAGRAAWRGALLSTAGLVVLLALVDPVEAHTLDAATAGSLATVTLAGLAVLMLAATRLRRPAARSVTLAIASGAAFGMASVFTKEVTTDITDPLALGMVAILAPAGLLLSQAAYRGAGLSAPLATLTVVNPVVAAAVGVTVLGESVRYGVAGGVLAVAAGAVAAAGLVVLTAQAPSRPAEPAEDLTPAAHGPADGPSDGPADAPSGAPAAVPAADLLPVALLGVPSAVPVSFAAMATALPAPRPAPADGAVTAVSAATACHGAPVPRWDHAHLRRDSRRPPRRAGRLLVGVARGRRREREQEWERGAAEHPAAAGPRARAPAA